MQSPGEENGLADRMVVGQAASMEGRHKSIVGVGRRILCWKENFLEVTEADCQSAAG